jgi:hypothetical protein
MTYHSQYTLKITINYNPKKSAISSMNFKESKGTMFEV